MTRAVAEGADIGGDVEGDADLSIVVDGDSDENGGGRPARAPPRAGARSV